MPTQTINLSDTQAEFIRQSLEAGDYNNASELVNESLRLLQAHKDSCQAKIDLVRAELQKGFDDREAGRYIELDTKARRESFFADVNRRGLERLANEANNAASSTE